MQLADAEVLIDFQTPYSLSLCSLYTCREIKIMHVELGRDFSTSDIRIRNICDVDAL